MAHRIRPDVLGERTTSGSIPLELLLDPLPLLPDQLTAPS